MDKIQLNRINTRKLYKLETLFPVEKDQNISKLRSLGEKIWINETSGKKDIPEITAGRGLYHGDTFLSVCYQIGNQTPKIILARQHRKTSILIHELTHALGYWDHGEKFIKKYFDLLVKYGNYDYNFLLLTAYSVNINLNKLK